jgi:transcriptional regulator with XRE-family HTH domain
MATRSRKKSSKYSSKLGQKIRQAREQKGLRQADLGKLIGLSIQSISAFESGKITPASEHLEKIAYYTERPLHTFTGTRVAEALLRIEQMAKELAELKEILSEVVEQE